MRRSSQFAVFVVCVAVTLGGARYAYAREAVRHTDLDALYQQINRESFDGKLPEVEIYWDDLTEKDAYGITSFDGSVDSIRLDRRTVTSAGGAGSGAARIVSRLCRAAGSEHGDEWKACMERF